MLRIFVLLLAAIATTTAVNPAAAADRQASAVTAGQQGFALESADGQFQLSVQGLLQTDARAFLEDDAPGEDDELLLRRARITFDGRFGERLSFRIRPESSGGTVSFIDAYVDAALGGLTIRAGKFKPPVGLERLQSASDLRLVERSFVTELVPSRDVGVELRRTAGAISWQLGLFNGVVDGRTADVSDDGKFEVAGRVFFEPLKSAAGSGTTFGVGIGASAGEREGSAALPLLAGIRSPGQNVVFGYRADTRADGTRTRVSPQAYWYRGTVGFMAEWARVGQTLRRADRDGDVGHRAFQVTAEWNVRGGPTGYRGAPETGTVQLVARVEELRIDDAAFAGGDDAFADAAAAVRRARSAGVGVNWFLRGGLKASVAYRHTVFDGGAAVGDRPDEQVVLSRLQFVF